jgi:beta-glucosidase
MFLALVIAATASTPLNQIEAEPWARAEALVAQMTLDEKISMVQGNSPAASKSSYIGIVTGVPRLSIPDFRMNDGPQVCLLACVPGFLRTSA